MNPVEAKKYFVEKINAQAQAEGRPLDELEVAVLHFTETGADACQEYLDASDRFDRERDMEQFEARVVELLRSAFAREIDEARAAGREKEVREAFRLAREAFGEEDHYIRVMIDTALGSQLRKRFLGLF